MSLLLPSASLADQHDRVAYLVPSHLLKTARRGTTFIPVSPNILRFAGPANHPLTCAISQRAYALTRRHCLKNLALRSQVLRESKQSLGAKCRRALSR